MQKEPIMTDSSLKFPFWHLVMEPSGHLSLNFHGKIMHHKPKTEPMVE